MRLFHDLPIKRKLMAITTLASGIALCVASLAFVVFDQYDLRRSTVRDLSITAAITGANCAAGLTFNEPGSVEQTLKSLGFQPAILRACVYDKDGYPFAIYQKVGQPGPFRPPPPQADLHSFKSGQLEMFHRIRLAREDIGTVYLVMDLHDMLLRIWQYTLIGTAVLLVSMLVALFLSSRLQKVISEPLTDLAQVVARVGTEKHYSMRAPRRGAGEVGRLIDGFNEMLGQIQQRDGALESARANLERRVEDRTKELAGSLSLLNATLESTTDGIVAVDHTGKITCYNQRLVDLWQIPPETIESMSYPLVVASLASQTTSPEQFLQWINEQRANPEHEQSNVLLLKDGRIFERRIRPQKIDGQTVGQVIIVRDITERRQSEAKLEEVSRQAGMAEIATNVLHNVGNVLNSVNTSTALIKNKLRDCEATDLRAVADHLAENQNRLAAFLQEDNRAAQLVEYLRQLDQHLASSQASLLTEFDGLLRNIEHIKEIVAMQQNYARNAGMVELQSLSWLLEDALRMYDGALGRHQVRIVRHFKDVPSIPLDKHKVLQILVNLLSNAKRAMSVPQITERILTLSVDRFGVDRARIRVADTGVGISAENLKRIFNHGFTTRADGHGFGLHSAALAAKEMGGTLWAESGGPGKGATFTLELPIFPPASNS